MYRRQMTALSILACCFFAIWLFIGGSSHLVTAQGQVPADPIPVTCSTFGIDSSVDRYLDCVNNGGIDSTVSYQAIPAGKYLFITDIAMVPTQVFTTTTPAMLRLSRDPVSGSNNIFYEMRIIDSVSKHVSFTTPIIRVNEGERIFAENLTSNSFTNDLRVYVTGWLTDSDTYTPTAIYGMQSQADASQAAMPLWQVILFAMLVWGTGTQIWQGRKIQPPHHE